MYLALWTNYTLNIAIGLQVLLGALTTGISSAVTTLKQASLTSSLFKVVSSFTKGHDRDKFRQQFWVGLVHIRHDLRLIFIAGGLATLVASYLARARGSGEPELSITRVKDIEQFLRDARAFHLDHGHRYSAPGDSLEGTLNDLRHRFEELLGNASGLVVIAGS